MQKLLILLSILFFGCMANRNTGFYIQPLASNNKPFQIIDGFCAFSSIHQKNLRRFQYLQINDTISINKYGHLIIAHYSGKLLELTDTTFYVNTLADTIASQLSIDTNELSRTVDINNLWTNKMHHLGHIGHVTPRGIDINYPLETQIDLSPINSVLEFKWSSEQIASGHYTIQISNIFNDVLESIETTETSITIDFNQYPDEDIRLFLLEIFDKENLEISSGNVGISINSMYEFTPRRSIPESAIDALELAFYFKRNNRHAQARPYFEQAAQLSDLNIYQELNQIHN